MRHYLIMISLVVLGVLQFCCNKTEQKTIIIYGAESCHHCRDLKSSLDSADLKYEFNDVEMDNQQHQVMLDLIKSHQVSGRINYPIVLLEKELIVGADFSKVQAKL